MPIYLPRASTSGGGDLLADGSVPLTANWDLGPYSITALRFISDVATGTAPFTVASTTLVSNLNADLLDGNEASAFATSTHNHDADYISVVTTPTAGNFPQLTAGGELVNSAYDETSFATAAHNHAGVYEPADATILKDADIGVTVQAYDATILVDADIGVSVAAQSHNHDSDYISVVSTPTAGNFPQLTAGGELINSAYDETSFATASHNHDTDYISIVTTPTSGNFPQLTAGGELVNSAYDETSFATAAQGALAATALQSLDIDSTPDSDHTVEGITATFTAAELLVYGDICYVNASGSMAKADASAVGTSRAVAMAAEGISAAASGSFLLFGIARDDTWAWTVGGEVYLSETAGALTQTAPTTASSITQVIGVATHADRILFNPSLDIVTHA